MVCGLVHISGGVNYYAADSDQFRLYPYGGSSNHLSGKAVRGLALMPDGGLYVATEDGGLNHLSADRVVTRAEVLNHRIGIDDVKSVKNVHALLLTEERYLWIGFLIHSVVRYDTTTGETIDYSKYGNISIFCFCEDVDGNIWAGGPSGLYIFDGDNHDSKPKRVPGLGVHAMLLLDEHTMLIGTRRGGLYRVDTQSCKVTPYDLLTTQNLHITYLYRDSQSRIWVGVSNDRLYQLDGNGEFVTTYTKEDIGSADVKSIVEDNQNNIWVATGTGLCRINPINRRVRRYTVADGLPTNQFNFASACKSSSGELFFGTIDGLISLYPNDLIEQKANFNVVVTDMLSNSQHIATDDIILSYQQAQSLTILYSGLNYKYNENTHYSMMMEGLDSDWQYVGNQHRVRISNIAAGDYMLRIKASSDGVSWDEEGSCSLKIKVLPPWWLSAWAYVGYLLLIIFSIYLFVYYTRSRLTLEMQLRSEQSQRESIEQLNRQKTDFFTYVSHDLRTPLTLILSPLKQMISRRREGERVSVDTLEVVYRNASRMNDLVDELLTHSKIEMNQMKMNLRRGDIMLFLKELAQIFDITAEDRDMEFDIDVDELGRLVWFSPSKLERIIYNLLSNAFKYTPNGGSIHLRARFLRSATDGATLVEISVKDSGRGIDETMQKRIFESYYQVDKRDQRLGFGLGLSLTRSLIQLHKGTISVVSEPNMGSEFIATINVTKESFSEAEYSTDEISQREQQRHNKSLQERINMIPNRLMQPEMGVAESLSKSKPTILIVEDSLDMNQYLREIFDGDFEVLCGNNGEEALLLIEGQQPEIIICDVMMPIMDGLEFTRRIKGNVETSHIPIILLTAKAEVNEYTEGYIAGADGYITKPFDAQNLRLLVDNTLRNREQNRLRFQQDEVFNISTIVSNDRDSEFMQSLVDLVMENLSNDNFSVADAVEQMGVSRTVLYNKLKTLGGVSFTQLVRSLRMSEAKKMLLRGLNISEVTFAVGMSDPSYFTKCFKREFNTTPSEFVRDAQR
ncbi:MAG: response regulator [Rikenellaceae bacterium]